MKHWDDKNSRWVPGPSTGAKVGIGCGIVSLIAIVVLCISLSQTASCSRTIKSVQSDFSGGMERTVTVYDYNGEVIAEYEGLIDIEYEDGRVLFDMDGKRTNIVGGIVIVQEE